MSNCQIFSENNSVKMFVLSKMQRFPNRLFNISTGKSEIGNFGREGKRAEMESQKWSLFIYLSTRILVHWIFFFSVVVFALCLCLGSCGCCPIATSTLKAMLRWSLNLYSKLPCSTHHCRGRQDPLAVFCVLDVLSVPGIHFISKWSANEMQRCSVKIES